MSSVSTRRESEAGSAAQALQRARLWRAIRTEFADRGFVETETPVLLSAPALEEYIDAIPAGPGWLRTSPELHMKRLLGAGIERLFQIGPCFRAGEHGRRHRQEFTMLEWYWAGAGYLDLLAQTEDWVAAVARRAFGRDRVYRQGREISLRPPWQRLTVHEAFARYAGVTPEAALASGDFDLLLVERVEPQLGFGSPCFLIDYPLALGALARAKPDAPHLAERWELYAGGLELANAYGELIDAAEQRRRFADCAAKRQAAGRVVYPLDEDFLAALAAGLPACAGCALGLDRLLMILTECDDIADVRPF